MINYEEELKKFKPSLDVDEAEGAIYSRDLTDVIDILKEMLKETSGSVLLEYKTAFSTYVLIRNSNIC